MSKKVAVLFSGGLDSTYLVWKNLKDGNEVIPVYIEIQNNKVKTIMEKNRIALLWKRFYEEFNTNKSYYEMPLKPIEYATTVSVNTGGSGLLFRQVPIWVFGAIFLQGIGADEIQIAYVCNDDAISYLDDIRKVYDSYHIMCESTIKPLVFPLTKSHKHIMAHELPSQYFELIFSCENAKIIGDEKAEIIEYEPCCDCVSCSHIIASNYYGIHRFPDNYKKPLLNKRIEEIKNSGYKVFDPNGKEYFTDDEKLLKEFSRPSGQLEIQFPVGLSQFKTPRVFVEELDSSEEFEKSDYPKSIGLFDKELAKEKMTFPFSSAKNKSNLEKTNG